MSPSANHEERKSLLEDLAILSGFSLNPSVALPGGSRPDVFRIDPICGAVFLGDAKDTETPGCDMTSKRLSCYMEWFKVFIDKGLLGSIFILCFGQSAHISGWEDVVSRLAKENKIDGFVVHNDRLDDEVYMVWMRVLAETINEKTCTTIDPKRE